VGPAWRLLHVVDMRACSVIDVLEKASQHDAPEDPPPSQRKTLDVAALASIAGLHDSHGNIPLDRCVPVRTHREAPATISRDEIHVLLYVDGATSLRRIAEETELSLPQTLEVFFSLIARGLVDVVDEPRGRLASRERLTSNG
jgi:hypothetical protein